MKLDEQQQNKIMWVVGVAVGLALIYFALLSPFYFAPRADLDKQIRAQQKLLADNINIKTRATTANVKWKELNIPTDPNAMEAELRQTILSAAGRSAGNFDISKWAVNNPRALTLPKTADRSDPRTDFVELHFTANASTTTAHVGRFLTYLESIKMPAKIDKIKIVSRKSGTDDLNIEVSLSALVYAPRGGIPGVAVPTGTNPATAEATGEIGMGFQPGPDGIVKSADPPLPPGATIAEQMKLRRKQQIEGTSPEKSPTTTPK